MKARVIELVMEEAKRRRLTSVQVADAFGVQKQTYTNWKRRGIPPDMHRKAAKFLGMSIDRMLGIDAMPSSPETVSYGDIPQRRIDLIRMYGRLPPEVRQPIRALIESLAYLNHEHRDVYVRSVESATRAAKSGSRKSKSGS